MYPQRQANPVGLNRARPGNEYATSPDARFPYVLTTYRLTEHHTAGGMSRTLSHLAELQPELFCEISLELAQELKIEHGEWVTLVTARGAIEAHALSTSRIQPLKIGDKLVHQIGLPFHWGYNGLVKGDIGNDLIAISEEPNVQDHGDQGLALQFIGRQTRGQRGEVEGVSFNRRRQNRMTDSVNVSRSVPRKKAAFLTDATICIGCKACEVACKEWNEVPDDGMNLDGLLVRQHASARRIYVAPRDVSRTARRGRPTASGYGESVPVDFLVGRLQTLWECRMPGSVSDRRDRPDQRRLGAGADRCLQWLRLLRGVVPVRRS